MHENRRKKRVIHDEEDEIEPIDFSWFYFIGKAKLNMSFHEVGRLTLRTFFMLYEHYKQDFDLELKLRLSGTTYAEAYDQAQEAEEWF